MTTVLLTGGVPYGCNPDDEFIQDRESVCS
jgi:hypothetical protein